MRGLIAFILLIAACAAFFCAWGGWPMGPLDNLVPLGLCLWTLSQILGGGVPSRKGT